MMQIYRDRAVCENEDTPLISISPKECLMQANQQLTFSVQLTGS